MSPYPNEHACRLKSPSKYKKFARGKRSSKGKTYSIIYGIFYKNGKKISEDQAYRYSKESWTAAQARKHCKDHNGRFEAAKEE